MRRVAEHAIVTFNAVAKPSFDSIVKLITNENVAK